MTTTTTTSATTVAAAAASAAGRGAAANAAGYCWPLLAAGPPRPKESPLLHIRVLQQAHEYLPLEV